MISEEQRQSVKEWLAAGDSLADVQRKLKSEYELTMTYMDVRLLVLEIGAEVQEEPEPEPEPEPTPPAPPPPPAAQGDAPRPGPWKAPDAEPEDDGSAEPNVSLSIDRLVVPGAMVSGDVTFTDGTKARWMIDNQGRFGLQPEVEGYHPTDEDLQMFQLQLRAELQRKGYA